MLSDRDYDLISGYLDDALNESERAEVESRLARDAEFAAELTALRRTVALVKALPQLAAPRDFRLTREQAAQLDREKAALQPPKRTTVLSFRRTLISFASAAASLMLVVVGFLALSSGTAPASAPMIETMGGVAMLSATATAAEEIEAADTNNQSPTLERNLQTPSVMMFGTAPAPIAPTSEDDDMSLRSMGGGGSEGELPGMGGAADTFVMPMMATSEFAASTLTPDEEALFESAPAATIVADTAAGTGSNEDVAVTSESPEMADTMMMQAAPAVMMDETANNAAGTSVAADSMMIDPSSAGFSAPENTQGSGLDAPQSELNEDGTAKLLETAYNTPLVGLFLIGAGVILGIVAFIARPKKTK